MADDLQQLHDCAVCKKPVGNVHTCLKCERFVHIFCGTYDESKEGFGASNICFNCSKKPTSSSSEPSSSTAAGAGSWKFLKWKSGNSKNNINAVDTKSSSQNPLKYTCLKCGSELIRGTNFHKKRHFKQMHADDDENESLKCIVQSDHELAVKRRKKDNNDNKAAEKKKQEKLKCSSNSKLKNVEEVANQNINDDVIDTSPSPERDVRDVQHTTVQSSLDSFLATKTDNQHSNKPSLESVQKDLNEIKIMLGELSISKSSTVLPLETDHYNIKESNNLLELSLVQDLKIKITDNGCTVQCLTCHHFQQSSFVKKMTSMLSNNFGSGLEYDKSKTELLVSGKCQAWYSFKNHVVGHFGCVGSHGEGSFHFKAKQHQIKSSRKDRMEMKVSSNVVSTAITVCKIKSAGLSFEGLLSLVSMCGGDIGNIGHGRNQFPEIISAAYQYLMRKTQRFLKTPLPSTGLCPHISVAADKSTPRRQTNHAIMIILPNKGKRVAMPIDAALVYKMSDDNQLLGGSGIDLADQITDALKQRLAFDSDSIHYIRAFHADGQYQCAPFQQRFLENFKSQNKSLDPFMLMPWDTSHWFDLVMESVREKETCAAFFKRLIGRCNRFNTMFRHGKGHEEYKGLTASLGLKSLEVVGYSTTRFFSSSYEQWDTIIKCYPGLIETYCKFRVDEKEDCDETNFQVRGQDFIIDLCGALDILKPIVLMMIRTQAVDLPPWKISVWFERLIRALDSIQLELEHPEQFSRSNLPNLADNWDDITRYEDDEDEEEREGVFKGMDLLPGWLVVNQVTEEPDDDSNEGKQKKTKKVKKSKKEFTWSVRNSEECVDDLRSLAQEVKILLKEKYDSVVQKEVKDLAKIFDLEETISLLADFRVENNKLIGSRSAVSKWETHGSKEFKRFFKYVCELPHVEALYEENHELNLLPHHFSIILKNFRTVLKKMVFETHSNDVFTSPKGQCLEYVTQSKLVKITPVKEENLDTVFLLSYENGSSEEAIVSENSIAELFYTDESVYTALGQEVCIALDVALSSGGCEAVVEGFYSLVGTHNKHGKQLNSTLTERAIVDWCLPLPIACPATMDEITKLYIEGDKELGLKKHRHTKFFDHRQRTNYKVGKVIDRLAGQEGRCPHVLA